MIVCKVCRELVIQVFNFFTHTQPDDKGFTLVRVDEFAIVTRIIYGLAGYFDAHAPNGVFPHVGDGELDAHQAIERQVPVIHRQGIHPHSVLEGPRGGVELRFPFRQEEDSAVFQDVLVIGGQVVFIYFTIHGALDDGFHSFAPQVKEGVEMVQQGALRQFGHIHGSGNEDVLILLREPDSPQHPVIPLAIRAGGFRPEDGDLI